MDISEKTIQSFLEGARWNEAAAQDLAGDASSRRYRRLLKNGKSAILMIDPSIQTVSQFLKVTEILKKDGYSAPDILARDIQKGLLLLEDFGDRLFVSLIEAGENEEKLYTLAVDFLLDLRTRKLPEGLPYFSPSYVLDQNVMFLDWFVPHQSGKTVSEEGRRFYQQIWTHLLKSLDRKDEAMLLRDFHAENILYLEGRTGLSTLGLLDYQDAMTGPTAYDLVSLLQDARRTVPLSLEEKMLDYYILKSGVDGKWFRETYAILGAHRALRILGIFTRLLNQDGKDRYQQFVPRVKTHLKRNLEHPSLLALQHWLTITLGKNAL
ncbi:MAG: phosphotransferase [Sneathiellales bacterium]|nr:phosphotransferase [Sneathiellales bacterium]